MMAVVVVVVVVAVAVIVIVVHGVIQNVAKYILEVLFYLVSYNYQGELLSNLRSVV